MEIGFTLKHQMLAQSNKIQQPNSPIECPICFNESNGLIVSFHTYNRYHWIWIFKKKQEQPLIKCIKCSFYACSFCLYKLMFCPQNCNEIDQPKTIIHRYIVYQQYAADKAYKYPFAQYSRYPLYLAQSVYDQQQNPKPELLKPCTKEQVMEALAITISLFDKVSINLDTQKISAYIKMPFQKKLIYISYKVDLIVQIEISYEVRDPEIIYNLLKDQFQQDIIKFFNMLACPFAEIHNIWREGALNFPHFEDRNFSYFELDLIQPENRPSYQLSVAEMGHSDAILKMLHNYIVFCDSRKGNPCIDEDFYITDAEYQNDIGIQFHVQFGLNEQIQSKYQVKTASITEKSYLERIEPQIKLGMRRSQVAINSRVASPQEFKDYFKIPHLRLKVEKFDKYLNQFEKYLNHSE